MWRRWCVLALFGLMAAASCVCAKSRPYSSHRQAPPVWAVAIDWPFHNGLNIQYNAKRYAAPMHGAYTRTSGVASAAIGNHWRTHTWKLANVDFAGRQNGGADLRLACSSGLAVHAVTLTMRPRALIFSDQNNADGLTAGIIFDTCRVGAAASNTGHILRSAFDGTSLRRLKPSGVELLVKS